MSLLFKTNNMNSERDDYNDGRLPSIVLQPHIRQYFVDSSPLILLAAISMTGYMMTRDILNTIFAVVFFVICFLLLCRYLKFVRIKYIITPEQLIYLHGIFVQLTDYMELYRIVDYQQHRSILQQLFGLKTIYLYSGDRSLPVLAIEGVLAKEDVVTQIRYRVEYNKRRKSVYEITNHN